MYSVSCIMFLLQLKLKRIIFIELHVPKLYEWIPWWILLFEIYSITKLIKFYSWPKISQHFGYSVIRLISKVPCFYMTTESNPFNSKLILGFLIFLPPVSSFSFGSVFQIINCIRRKIVSFSLSFAAYWDYGKHKANILNIQEQILILFQPKCPFNFQFIWTRLNSPRLNHEHGWHTIIINWEK